MTLPTPPLIDLPWCSSPCPKDYKQSELQEGWSSPCIPKKFFFFPQVSADESTPTTWVRCIIRPLYAVQLHWEVMFKVYTKTRDIKSNAENPRHPLGDICSCGASLLSSSFSAWPSMFYIKRWHITSYDNGISNPSCLLHGWHLVCVHHHECITYGLLLVLLFTLTTLLFPIQMVVSHYWTAWFKTKLTFLSVWKIQFKLDLCMWKSPTFSLLTVRRKKSFWAPVHFHP